VESVENKLLQFKENDSIMLAGRKILSTH